IPRYQIQSAPRLSLSQRLLARGIFYHPADSVSSALEGDSGSVTLLPLPDGDFFEDEFRMTKFGDGLGPASVYQISAENRHHQPQGTQKSGEDLSASEILFYSSANSAHTCFAGRPIHLSGHSPNKPSHQSE